MLLFRSEAHVHRWLVDHAGGWHLAGRPAGMTISVSKLAELAEAWWWDRLDPAWQPHTQAQNQAILDRLGLTGDFWSLG